MCTGGVSFAMTENLYQREKPALGSLESPQDAVIRNPRNSRSPSCPPWIDGNWMKKNWFVGPRLTLDDRRQGFASDGAKTRGIVGEHAIIHDRNQNSFRALPAADGSRCLRELAVPPLLILFLIAGLASARNGCSTIRKSDETCCGQSEIRLSLAPLRILARTGSSA